MGKYVAEWETPKVVEEQLNKIFILDFYKHPRTVLLQLLATAIRTSPPPNSGGCCRSMMVVPLSRIIVGGCWSWGVLVEVVEPCLQNMNSWMRCFNVCRYFFTSDIVTSGFRTYYSSGHKGYCIRYL
jgi:hypothetical protein